MNDTLSKHLELVESNLVRTIQGNFEFFSDAFTNFDGMKLDMVYIADKS